MNAARTTALLTAGLLATLPAFAGYPGDYRSDQDDDIAQVLSAEPMVRSVYVSVPQRECRVETRYVPVNARRSGELSAGPMLLGGLIGAAIGHRIDQQGGYRRPGPGGVGIVAGALIGTAIGHEVAEGNRRRYDARDEYRAVDAERCEVRTVEHVEEQVDGYRVTYRYQGRIYTTRMPYDPGSTLRVRVNVSPVG